MDGRQVRQAALAAADCCSRNGQPLKLENAAETALLMTITGSNLIAEAARAREPRRVWVGSSLFGMSAFRNLRPLGAEWVRHRRSRNLARSGVEVLRHGIRC